MKGMKNFVRKRYAVGLFSAGLVCGLIISNVNYANPIKVNKNEIKDENIVTHSFDENGIRIQSEKEEVINDGKPYLKYYDGNGQVMESYSQDQMEELVVETVIYKESTVINNGQPIGIFYDKNGVNLDPSKEIEEEMLELSNLNEYKLHVFRISSFMKSIQIGKTRTFNNPVSLIIEPKEKFGFMSIYITNSTGKRAGRIEMGNYNWVE